MIYPLKNILPTDTIAQNERRKSNINLDSGENAKNAKKLVVVVHRRKRRANNVQFINGNKVGPSLHNDHL